MLSNSPAKSPPNPDVFNSHFTKGVESFKARRYDEACIHFTDAAEAMERLIDSTFLPEVRTYREEAFKELLELAKTCQEMPKKKASSTSNGPGSSNGDKVPGNRTDSESSIDVKSLRFTGSRVRFDDIIGHEVAKKLLTDSMVWPFRNAEICRQFNVEAGGGILFFGPPGTGKTELAAATAAEVDADFYVVRGSDIVSKWYGEAEKNVRSLFDGIRKESKRAVIFLDDCSALMSQGDGPSGGPQGRILGEFLVELEGIQKRADSESTSILFIAATNTPWEIADSMIGRFKGGRIFMDLPSEQDRERILQIKSVERHLAKDVNFKEIARLTEGLSGRELTALCKNAHLEAAKSSSGPEDLAKVTQDMLLRQVKRVRPVTAPATLARLATWNKERGVSSTES